MARRSQPYRLTWPLGPEQLENIDSMFQELFDDLDNGSLEINANQVTAGVFLVPQGGTGLDSFVIGDILYASDTEELSALASVTEGSYLRSAGVATAPVWSTLKLPNAATLGDILYASAADTLVVLAKDTNATRYLSNTGTDNIPAWAQVALATGVSGDLPFANLTQIAGLSVLGVTGNATADVAAITAGSDNQVLRRSGTALTFGAVNLASSSAVTGDLPFANLAQGAALSVLGVTGNATADVASIAAGTDHQVLRRSGTALTFGAVNIASADAVTGTLVVANGGTGAATFTAYAVITAGTTATGAFQNVSGVGTSGQVLTSNGAAMLPSWQAAAAGNSEATVTTTGNIAQLSSSTTVVRMDNATDSTIQGIAAGTAGQVITIISVGAGHVFLAHQNGSASAADRLINPVTSGNTPLAAGAGVARLVYDDTTDRWRLVEHTQGAWITPTFAAGDYTSSVGGWTVASTDTLSVPSSYYLFGNKALITLDVFTSSVTTPAPLSLFYTLQNGWTIANVIYEAAPGIASDNSNTTLFIASATALINDTRLQFKRTDGATWTLTTNLTSLQCTLLCVIK